MDPDRRRRIARKKCAKIDSIPVGVDGPGDFDLADLVATTKLEADLVSRLTDEMERGRAVAKALDAALVSSMVAGVSSPGPNYLAMRPPSPTAPSAPRRSRTNDAHGCKISSSKHRSKRPGRHRRPVVEQDQE